MTHGQIGVKQVLTDTDAKNLLLRPTVAISS